MESVSNTGQHFIWKEINVTDYNKRSASLSKKKKILKSKFLLR